MKEKFAQKTALYNKMRQKKSLIYTICAVGSFLVLLFFSVRLRGDGIPFILCLTLHTCALLLLYRDALMALDPEGWKTEQDWMQEDLPPEEIELPEALPEPSPENKILYRRIYAEVKESLVDGVAAEHTPAEDEPAPAEEESLPAWDAPSVEEEPSPVENEGIPVKDAPFAEDGAAAPTEDVPPAEDAPPAETPQHAAFLTPPQQLVEMDLIAAARDAIASLSSFADAQRIKLNLSTACDTLPIKADPESIRTLFRNIIDNSIKYMGRPGHMIITVSLLGDDIFLILKDTGNGLAEDETLHVFELNFQGSNRVSGNGLGLAQAKMIVEAFGGTIYAKSSPGNGMAIYIQLPVYHSS